MVREFPLVTSLNIQFYPYETRKINGYFSIYLMHFFLSILNMKHEYFISLRLLSTFLFFIKIVSASSCLSVLSILTAFFTKLFIVDLAFLDLFYSCYFINFNESRFNLTSYKNKEYFDVIGINLVKKYWLWKLLISIKNH